MALTSGRKSDLEVLQRKVQRLLWLCRALEHCETFGMLCAHFGQDSNTALELEPEFTRLLALVNAGSILTEAEMENQLHWTTFHLQAFEDIWAAVKFFEEFPAGQASHVA